MVQRVNQSSRGSRKIPLSKKDLTVVILTYNSAATIQDTLNSLWLQTYKHFRVLIVDDDSTDETLKIVSEFSKNRLNVEVVRNGSHSIPKGRNIGLKNVQHGIVAFLDSDDTAQSDWLEVIAAAFSRDPELALVSGEQVFSHSTYFAKAIGYNDETMRRLFIRGLLLFCTCNCAINRDVIGDYYFNEDFKNGEDLEFGTRVAKLNKWEHLTNLKVNHKTRDNPKAYAKQMYMYGFWKVFFYYWTSTFRIVDFIPLLYGISCFSLVLVNPYLATTALFFPLCQTAVSAFVSESSVIDIPTMFLAWCIKDVAWSMGILHGIIFTSLRMGSKHGFGGKEGWENA